MAAPDHIHAARGVRDRRVALVAAAAAVWSTRPRDGAAAVPDPVVRLLHDLVEQLADSLAAGHPALFAEHVAWCRARLLALEAPPPFLHDALEALARHLVAESRPPRTPEAERFLDEAVRSLADASPDVPGVLDPTAPHAETARGYLEALLAGRRSEALRQIHAAVAAGVSIRDVYLWVFQPVLREVGRLWQTGQCTVAHEHYVTAATQQIVSTLYKYVFATERVERTMIACCVSGELHEFGIRMVADFFEMEGWDAYYLGASAPTSDTVAAVAERSVDLVAISATMTAHVPRVRELVGALRGSERGARVPVLVGGHPFVVVPRLWREMGADGTAADAPSAVALGRRLAGDAP